MRVYLAGPMTGIPEFNYPLFHASSKWLRDAGYEVVSPAEINPAEDAEHPWEWFMRRDIVGLMDCDAVVVLPGWRDSKGATLETTIARALRMPVWDIEAIEPLEVSA